MTTESSTALAKLAEDIWQNSLNEYPELATILGDLRNAADLTDTSEGARERRRNQTKAFLEQLAAIDKSGLSEEETITADIIKEDLEQSLEGDKFEFHKWSVDQLSGIQVSLPTLLRNFHPKETKQNWLDLVSRMQKAKTKLENAANDLIAGSKEGYKIPRVGLERVIGQVDGILEQSPSVFHKLADLIPEDMEDKEEIGAAIADAAETSLLPGMKLFRAALNDHCLPVASDNNGLWDNKNGLDCYRYMIRQHLSQPFEAEEIHQIGLEQVAKIHKEMDEIAKSQGMSREEYAIHLTKEESNFHKTKEALVEEYTQLVEKANKRLPELFTILPKTGCEVRAIEPYREKDAPTGFYNPPTQDGSRPGLFYANTYQPETRMRSNMACLTYHEAVPGHHLQIALAMEMDMPHIRRHGRFTAYVEGWALYTERLCDEIGLYDLPRDRFGMLGYQAWRAARLVVDTGIHAMEWSREKAIEYLNSATSLPQSEVVNEIDRYLIMPGQALSYKIGEIEIQKIRAKAKAELGEKFDIKAFHDRLLGSGAIPLQTLHAVMDRWIEGQKAA